MNKNQLFNKMASEILANSSKNKTPKIDLGQKLCDSFIKKLLTKYKCLKEVESKFVKVFYKDERNILSVEKQTAAIKITINAKKGSIKDSKNLLRDVSKIGHWGNGDYQIKLENNTHFDDVLKMIEQIY
jgi:predicted transport protein